jgi:hypothetical protein
MDNEMKSSLTATDTWVRGLYMLLFAVIYSVTEFVLGLIVVFQFIHVLFSRDTNDRLLDFSSDLSVYIYQILQFLTFNSEAKPFPFAVWPNGPEDLESLDLFDNVEVGPEVGPEVEPEVDGEANVESNSEPSAAAAVVPDVETGANRSQSDQVEPASTKASAKASTKDSKPDQPMA